MTGFARVVSDSEPAIEISIRTVNHRFLDLKIRTPTAFEALDPLIRRVAKEHLKRGSAQISISLESNRESSFELNRDLADAYLRAHTELSDAHRLSQEPDLMALLRIPGILGSSDQQWPDERRAEIEALLEQTLIQAFTALNEQRAQEGAGIAADVRERTEAIAKETESLKAASAAMIPQFQERLEKRLSHLLGETPIDPQRILQEAAVLADRTDVSEELQRLAGHSERLLEILEKAGETGKNIDFLAQEMNREANTLVSKSTPLGEAGLSITEAGLRLKSEIEKIREQAQNLE
ncbi:MAG: YicC family protein [Acidobacteria bacterium]|nr:YicC family protein [Acidobacteriota bacterium]MDA1236165.1 YicC family protein [Acidobacteriota bacterium]